MSKETARSPGTAPQGLPLPSRRKARRAGRLVSGDVKKCYNMIEIYLKFWFNHKICGMNNPYV